MELSHLRIKLLADLLSTLLLRGCSLPHRLELQLERTYPFGGLGSRSGSTGIPGDGCGTQRLLLRLQRCELLPQLLHLYAATHQHALQCPSHCSQ